MSSSFINDVSIEHPAIGLWLGLANPYTAELCAGAGFDWLLVDGEHAPNDIQTILGQLQAIGTKAHAVVRPAAPGPTHIKPVLDIGATTLLVPMVETGEQAHSVVSATRYPPAGTRGVGSALARASGWGRTPGYLTSADETISVIVQIESPEAVLNVDAIAQVEGVDALFVGLSDLSASMGLLGQPEHRKVQSAFTRVLDVARDQGKPCGTLAANERLTALALDGGCSFLAVGTDVGVLTRGCNQLLKGHRREPVPDQPATY